MLKADGLAGGKGVIVPNTREEALAAVDALMIEGKAGDAGRTLVVEERLEGPEVSCFFICDGTTALPLVSAQDHKRIFDDDLGPNTGGMGAFAPSPLLTPALDAVIHERIVAPVLRGLAEDGTPFRGFLYAGLMLTADGPKVIEFNVRFGDPEAQVVLPMIESDLAPLLLDAAQGRLSAALAPQTRHAPARRRRPRLARLSGARGDGPGDRRPLRSVAVGRCAGVPRGDEARRTTRS